MTKMFSTQDFYASWNGRFAHKYFYSVDINFSICLNLA